MVARVTPSLPRPLSGPLSRPLSRLVGCVALALWLTVAGSPSAAARFVAGADDSAVVDGADLADVLGSRRDGPSPAPRRGVWPLAPRPQVVRPFDAPETHWGPGHRGADLAGHPGQRVRAALAGRVTFVGRVAGRGVVVVDHGSTRTTYEPVLATVSRGERVGAGAVIGRLTSTGGHCPPRACLHWGLRRGDAYLDPLTLVDAPRPVRLLPW